MRRFFICCTFFMLLLPACAGVHSDREYAEGMRLFKSQHYPEAQSHALNAYSERPEVIKYQALLGWTYLKQGNLTEARRLFSGLYTRDQISLPALMGLAWVEYSSGNLDQAEGWFQKELASAKRPTEDPLSNYVYSTLDQDYFYSCMSDANYGLGLVSIAKQDYPQAQSYLSNALKYQNDFIGHGPIRTALAASQGKNRQAVFAQAPKPSEPSKASLEKSIKANPYYADTPQVAKLIEQHQEWKTLEKDFAQAYLQMGDFKRAQEKLRAYLKYADKDNEARIMDAWCDMYLSRLPVALGKFNALTKGKKPDTQALLGRGVTKFYLGQLDQADADFRKVVAREPGNVRAKVARGAVAFKRGNLHQAIKIYSANLPYLPKKEPFFDWSSHALNNLGWSYIRAGKYQEALKTFDLLKNHHTRPIYSEPYDGLGWAYLYMGKKAEAQQAFQQSLKLAPGDVVAKNGLSKLAEAQK